MIAKPTKKTIPIAILLILIVALLGWLCNSGEIQKPKPKPTIEE